MKVFKDEKPAEKPKAEVKSELKPSIEDLDAYLIEQGGKSFDLYLSTEKHGDMETDQWARRNFLAGFKAGFVLGKGK